MKKYIPLALVLLGIMVNLFSVQNIFLGSLCVVLFFLIIGGINGETLEKIIGIKNGVVKYIMGSGVSILLFGFLTSIFVVWYRLPAWIVGSLFIVFTCGSLALRTKIRQEKQEKQEDFGKEVFGLFPKSKFIIFCFGSFALLQILILYLCRSEEALVSPWQTIHVWYVYNFFLFTFLFLYLIFSRISLQSKLLFLFVYSGVLHLYLPLVHMNPWGGDVWRLMGVEGKLLDGAFEPPFFPKALINPYKYTYGQVWGLMASLAQVTKIPLVELHRWGMALLWSLLLPVFSFVLGRKIFGNEKTALVLSTISSFPFALQAIGSITVAVSLGFLSFLFGCILLFSLFESPTPLKKKLCVFFGVLSVFGYALYSLLFWLLFGILLLAQKYRLENTLCWETLSPKGKYSVGMFLLFGIVLFPGIDMVLGDRFSQHFSFFSALKRIAGEFGGWYFTQPISVREIASANIIFNHIHTASFVKNIFTTVRFPIILLMVGMSIFVLFAVYKILKEKQNIFVLSLLYIFTSVSGGYILGWYVLSGDRIFVRRLDAIFAWLLLVLALEGVLYFDFQNCIQKWSQKKIVTILIISMVVYSFVATTLYASGPDIRVVSKDETVAATYIDTQIVQKETACVLSDTYLLLALEGISNGKIVGGGFPISANFGQTQRVKLYSEFLKNPDARIKEQIQAVVSSPECFVAVSQKNIDSATEKKIHTFLGNALFKSGEILVWKLRLKNS